MATVQPQVLIIEDDKNVAGFFKTVLNLVGFKCEIIFSAKEALARLAHSTPDLILLESCLVQLRWLSREASVAVSVSPPKVVSPENGALLATLRAAADGIWSPPPALPVAEPPRLF